MKRIYRTDFPIPKSKFWLGFGSVLNLGGSLFHYNRTDEPDTVALHQDWLAVGDDLREVFSNLNIEVGHELSKK